jgi:membrane associated rhomboid family serine protease
MNQASVGFHCPECTRAGRQRVVPLRTLATRPVVTMLLVSANLAVFVGDLLSGASGLGGLNEWAAKGALAGPLVARGDWWRPITAGFIHANLLHVGFNMFLLWQLGRLLEPALRWWGFAVLYTMSLLGGSFLTLVLDPNVLTIGASGAVFGLMGATVIAMRSRGIDPFSTGIGPLLVLNLILTFTVPGISIGGHIGGLVAGGIGGWLLWEWGPRTGAGRSPILPVLACGAIAVGLYAGCLLIV